MLKIDYETVNKIARLHVFCAENHFEYDEIFVDDCNAHVFDPESLVSINLSRDRFDFMGTCPICGDAVEIEDIKEIDKKSFIEKMINHCKVF